MTEGKAFSLSANGDSWALETDPSTGEALVLHKANKPSGGHEDRCTVEQFLEVSAGKPEHDSLLQILGRSEDHQSQGKADHTLRTPSYDTALRYLELGGRRLAKVDDDIVSVRAWDIDPMDAEAFWQANIEALAENERQEVVLHLPSISDVDTDAGQRTASDPQDHQPQKRTETIREDIGRAAQEQKQPIRKEERASNGAANSSVGSQGGPEGAEPSPE